MASTKLFIFLSLAVFAFGQAERDRFDRFSVYSLTAKNDEQIRVLQHMNSGEYDFWTVIALGRKIEVMVPPNKLAEFFETMKLMNISHKISVKNIQA